MNWTALATADGPNPLHALVAFAVIAPGALQLSPPRRGPRHRDMIVLYVTALIVTGAFTLLPGRTMHSALFG